MLYRWWLQLFYGVILVYSECLSPEYHPLQLRLLCTWLVASSGTLLFSVLPQHTRWEGSEDRPGDPWMLSEAAHLLYKTRLRCFFQDLDPKTRVTHKSRVQPSPTHCSWDIQLIEWVHCMAQSLKLESICFAQKPLDSTEMKAEWCVFLRYKLML